MSTVDQIIDHRLNSDFSMVILLMNVKKNGGDSEKITQINVDKSTRIHRQTHGIHYQHGNAEGKSNAHQLFLQLSLSFAYYVRSNTHAHSPLHTHTHSYG